MDATINPVLVKMHAAAEPQIDLRKDAREVADQFEAIFVQSMIAGMRKTADMGGGEGLFGKGPGSDTYTQWFDTYMAGHLADNGRIGVSETLMREFERLGQIPETDSPTGKELQR